VEMRSIHNRLHPEENEEREERGNKRINQGDMMIQQDDLIMIQFLLQQEEDDDLIEETTNSLNISYTLNRNINGIIHEIQLSDHDHLYIISQDSIQILDP